MIEVPAQEGHPPAPRSRVGYLFVPNSFAHLVMKKVW